MAAEVVIDIIGRDNFSSTLGNFGNIVTGIKSAIDLVSGAFNTAVNAITPFIQSASDSEDAIANLNATLQSTGGAAGLTSEELQNMANSLQNVTRFSDEAILNGEAMLLTFTSIGSEVFPEATEAMLNLAAKFGSVDTAAVQLGKALNDPIAGVTALRRVGVQLTDEQEEMIKKFVEQGDIMAAQKIILGELQTEFGGLAEAMGGTFQGQVEILKNRFDNLKEGIGALIIDALMPLMDLVGGDSRFAAYVDTISAALATLDQYLDAGVPAFQAFGMVFKDLAENPLFAGIAGILEDIGNAFLTMQSALDNGQSNFEAFMTTLDMLTRSGGPLANLASFIQDAVSAFEDSGLVGLGAMLASALLDAINSVDWIGILDRLDAKIATAINSVDWSTSGAAFGQSLLNLSVDGVQSRQSTAAPAIANAIKNWIVGAFNILEVSGTNAVRNFFNGIEIAITDAVRGWFNNIELDATAWIRDKIVNPIKQYLGIASPSTVFTQMGRDIVQGLINGITGMLGSITSIIGTLVDNILAPLAPILDLLGFDTGTGTIGNHTSPTGTIGNHTQPSTTSPTGILGSAGSVTNNFYGTVYIGWGDIGYDCPSPNPLIAASANSLLTNNIG